MKSLLFFSLLMFTTLFISAQHNFLTQTIKGTVIDEQSGNVLENVTVTIEGITSIAAITDSMGNFKLQNVPIGRQTIRISFVGYEEAIVQNIEVTSSKEVILEVRLRERIKKLEEVVVTAVSQKNRALNEAAVVSARQFSVDEAVRYSGTRNDPSRMAQNFAGVSGTNDARNDIVIRGNSPAGVLWRLDGIDIPNPNHYSTLGATGGPVTILNTNTLKNSDFLTGAFPAQYGNAIAGVFDLRMRNGNSEKYEFLGEAGFNGFELGAEGPINRKTGSSFLVDYRYSLVAVIQAAGLDVGTGNAVPYYQDAHFKFHMPTKKSGTFDWFGLGGESHIVFPVDLDENLYATNDGSQRERLFNSLTGVTGLTHTYFFNPTAYGKTIFALSGFQAKYREDIIANNRPRKTAYDKRTTQIKYSAGYTYNKKFNSRNQLTLGFVADISRLGLKQDEIRNGDSVLTAFVDTKRTVGLLKGFTNLSHRFSDKLSLNLGVYYQLFTFNNSSSLEPRWNIKYQFKPGQSLSFGAGLHSQTQPLEIYFYRTTNTAGQVELTNKNLRFVKSVHGVFGYDINLSKHLRFKTEVYGQYIYNAAVEKNSSSFSMLNTGADFYFPDKTNLVNSGKGYNYGLEITLEQFLHKGFYYLITASVFQSKYKASDNAWRNTVFNSNYVTNVLVGKEFRINKKNAIALDSKMAFTGGQRYTPFNIPASRTAGYVIFKENEAYSLQNKPYWRWDFKISYARNGKRTTQKWYVDIQNVTNRQNIYLRSLDPATGFVGEVNQIGFFPNVNYLVTF